MVNVLSSVDEIERRIVKLLYNVQIEKKRRACIEGDNEQT